MIIAEISQNFGSDMILAKHLIRLAKENGADIVKAQLYDKSIGDNPLSFEDAKELFEYGKGIGIEVFYSVFDAERVDWCEKIGVKRYKLACNALVPTNLFETHKPVIFSTDSPLRINTCWTPLFCVPEYPADNVPYLSVNFQCQYEGISDHTLGIDVAKICIARGARIIEKHFALDHDTGLDARWSMTPSELFELKRWENVVHNFL